MASECRMLKDPITKTPHMVTKWFCTTGGLIVSLFSKKQPRKYKLAFDSLTFINAVRLGLTVTLILQNIFRNLGSSLTVGVWTKRVQ